MWFKLFTIDGLGVTHEMDVNGSSTPVSFQVVVPAGKVGIISRVVFHMVDGGMTWAEFGGITALSNGVLVRARDSNDDVLLDFMDGAALTSNSMFAHLAGVDAFLSVEAQDDAFSVRWSLFKTGYVPYLTAGQYLELLVQDNLSAITHFQAILQGRLIDE